MAHLEKNNHSDLNQLTSLATSATESSLISVAGIVVAIRSDREFAEAIRQQDMSAIFCDTLLNPMDFQVSVTVLVLRDSQYSYERVDDKTCVVTIPHNCNAVDKVFYAVCPLIEATRQAQGAVTVHAAGVCLADIGILILGKEGSGKTSVAMHLCEQGASIVGNDLVIIKKEENSLQLIGGTKYFNLRKASVSRSVPELLHHFPSDRVDAWSNKIIKSADALGIDISKAPVTVKLAISVHVDEDQEQLVISPVLNSLVARLTLFENFSRYIRATAIPGLDANNNYAFYIPSHDTPELHEKRISVLNQVLKSPIMYVSGRSRDIAQAVQRHISGENLN